MDKMKSILPKNEKQSGQVVIITLMILAVVLSVGMSIISRSITDVKTSQQTQESARAFWVAQGELEKAIRINSELTSGVGEDISYNVSKTEIGGLSEFTYPEAIRADYPVTIWLVDHNSDGSLGSVFVDPDEFTVYWGNKPTNNTAVELTFVYLDGTIKTVRYAYDPNNGADGSNFSDPINASNSIDGKDYYFSQTIDLSSLTNIYFARIKFIGNSDADFLAVRIDSDKSLPGQGSCFESTSRVEVSGISRKLASCQLWSVYPAIFDNVLFSGSSI